MTGEKAANMPLITRLLLIFMAAILLGLMVSFVRQVTVSHRQGQELAILKGEIERANEELMRLQVYLQHVRSEHFLRLWGRKNGWVKPGEVLVVPFGETVAPAPTADKASKEAGEQSSTRQTWWDLFFGSQ
jgi:hypothetical protein